MGPSGYPGRRRCTPVMQVSLRLRALSSQVPFKFLSGGTGVQLNIVM